MLFMRPFIKFAVSNISFFVSVWVNLHVYKSCNAKWFIKKLHIYLFSLLSFNLDIFFLTQVALHYKLQVKQ